MKNTDKVAIDPDLDDEAKVALDIKHETLGVTVSAVITAYNRSDYLFSALESVLDQDYPVEQVIVVDDCSTVDLKPVIARFESHQDYNKIVYHRLLVNSGANVARNLGVKLATSEWVAFLDDDDIWLSNKIFRQVSDLRLVSKEFEPIATLCSSRFVDDQEIRKTPRVEFVSSERLKQGNPYCGASGFMVRRDIISEHTFDDSLPCGQDWDIFVRLSFLGNVRYVPESLYLYRRGSHQGLTTKAKNMTISEAEDRLASAYKHRTWLGEKHFRNRVAGQILSYVFHKQDKIKWIRKSIELAGLKATALVLLKKVMKRLGL